MAARRRRPDRVRELHRPADRAPLPPEPALPRRAVAVAIEPVARARRSGCTGRSACTPSRSRSASSPTSSPSSTRSARARSASPSCGSAWAPTRRAGRGAARRLPARAPDPARRPAARRARAGRAPEGLAARALAGRAGPAITSLAYTTVRMEEPAARLLITLLDGTRDRAAIRAELRARAGLELSASRPGQQPRRARAAVPAGALAPQC